MGKIIKTIFCLLLAHSCYADSVLVSNNTDTDLSIHFAYCDEVESTVRCENYFPYDLPAHHKQIFALPSDKSILQVIDSIETSKKAIGISPFMPPCRAEPRLGVDGIILESQGRDVSCKEVKMPATQPSE